MLLLTLSCVDGLESAPSPAPLSIRLLPAMTQGREIGCEDALAGSADPQLWTVRLRVFFEPSSTVADVDRTLTQTALRTIDFQDIPKGQGYRVEVDLCAAPGAPSAYTGQARSVEVSGEGAATTVDLYMLPVEGYACPGVGATASWPETPQVFGSAGGSVTGDTAVFVGGASRWFGTDNPVQGTDAIAVFDQRTGLFGPGAARLPSPRLMSTGLVVRDPQAGRERLLVVGGTPSLVPFDSRATPVLNFGPAADDTPLPAPVWVDLDGGAVESLALAEGSLGHVDQAFAFGVGRATTGTGSGAATWVIAAGGVAFGGESPVRSTSVTLFKFSDKARSATVSLDVDRIAPGVVSPLPGIVAVVGGHDDGFLWHLLEVIDLNVSPPVHRSVQVVWQGVDPPERADLVRSSAFPHVIPLSGGSFLVLGGGPILDSVGANRGRVVMPPDRPILYRVDLAANGDDWVATVSVPPSLVAAAALAERAFATEVTVSDDEVWLVGGVAPTAIESSLFVGALADVVIVDRRTGELKVGPSAPWPTFGASSARLWGDINVIAGGVSPVANVATPVNAASLINRPSAAARTCGALETAEDASE